MYTMDNMLHSRDIYNVNEAVRTAHGLYYESL